MEIGERPPLAVAALLARRGLVSAGWKRRILKLAFGTPYARWRALGGDRLSSPVAQKHDDGYFAVRIVMKPFLFALCVVFEFGGLSAQPTAWQPSPGHTQVLIWPGAVPDAQP